MTGRHFGEHQPQREDIGARVAVFALPLLGRHVSGRAHHGLGCRYGFVAMRFGEAEVEHLDAGFRQHDVAGLEIAMRDALSVGGDQRFRDLDAKLERLLHRQRAFLQALGERLAFDQLHYQVIGANVVQRADVLMIERGYGARFAFETVTESFGQDLDGDLAT